MAHHTPGLQEAFRERLPQQCALHPDLVLQLVTQLSPRVLQQAGIPVFTGLQEEGQFVVTFPGAYHCAFSHGFNCTEAVNFAPPNWWQYAPAALERYRFFKRPAVRRGVWLRGRQCGGHAATMHEEDSTMPEEVL